MEIVCKISKAGDDVYTLNQKRVLRKYIATLAEGYSIETGNLCQFLAQDTVREFPELSPQMIFKGKINSITLGKMQTINFFFQNTVKLG